ncbi:response regulator [uncultured Sulfitobacter sp.]|jgi:DNA-binding response OmpR family regulator|uniref:response regulator n=1 Tax=Sulfitobacter sp. SH22 TaxID=3421172 RepID=UPI001B6682A0|nr:response regulator transcription factor [uncultured Sulfitobacter sp.]MBQ0803850.1 response regulator transcription factor [Sulfitobacter sp.]
MKILVVDDDPFIHELFPEIFGLADLTDVHSASGGFEALDIIAAQGKPFDCFVLDVDMPKMNGIELCQRIRALPGYDKKPILMLTARTDPISIENAFASGANDYISKPFNLKDIYNRIRVAERLSEASKTVVSVNALDVGAKDAAGVHDFELCEKLHLAHVDRLILSFSLGNYLTQLDRKALKGCKVFCVSLDDAQHLYQHSAASDFTTLLTDLGESIISTVDCPHLLMSYEGNGQFICVSRDTQLADWEVLEAGIQLSLEDTSYGLTMMGNTPITISVGTPIAPNANRTQRVKNTFTRAIGRAEMRHSSKANAA